MASSYVVQGMKPYTLRSYNRHTLVADPYEDGLNALLLKKQRMIELEKTITEMNNYLTVPAGAPDSPTITRARLASGKDTDFKPAQKQKGDKNGPDPQTYVGKTTSDSVPTIKVDLASPQSPDSVNLMDEFRRAGQQERGGEQEEDRGLVMKPPAEAREAGEAGEGPRDQRLIRCLSDPGPSPDEDEDEPFLP